MNLKEHGLDFNDAPRVFEGLTFTYEDDRLAYGEQRFVTLGLLAGVPVSKAHTESDDEIRVISFRKATSREARLFFDQVQD
ncbi:MAG: BrnT family toxin [Burkholderiaceae bacterium]|nr:BrnT family toxin [Burkholderiaceae bacterium]